MPPRKCMMYPSPGQSHTKEVSLSLIPYLGELLFVVLIAIPWNASAQGNNTLDSLVKKLENAQSDTAKINALYTISGYLESMDHEQALVFAQQMIDLAEDMQYPKGIAEGKEKLGRAYWRMGQFDLARENHFAARTIYVELKDTSKLVGINLYLAQDYADEGNYPAALEYLAISKAFGTAINEWFNTAVIEGVTSWVYNNMGMYPEAMQHEYEALKLFEKVGNESGIAICRSNLAATKLSQGMYAEAIEEYLRSEKILIKHEDYINAALTNIDLGRCYHHLDQFDKALSHYRKALEYGTSMKDENILGFAHLAIGWAYNQRRNYSEALHHVKESAKAFRISNNKKELSEVYALTVKILTQLNRYSEARNILAESNKITKELNSVRARNIFYQSSSILDSATGNWRNAYLNFQQFLQTRDSMYNEEATRKNIQAQMQYEYEIKESAARAEQEKKDALALQALKTQRTLRNLFIVGFSFVMLFSIVVLFQRNRISREKNRSEALLLNILPTEVASELKEKGKAEAQLIDQVTVLFTDFKDFTQYAEKLSPKDLVRDLNACFSEFDRICEKHQIEKIKTIGDAYMAAGGIPLAKATHAVDTVRAAIDMLQFIERSKTETGTNPFPHFDIRIGIHSGPVVAGIVGVKKFQYDIWGDTVNISSRMESSGSEGKINISEDTYQLVKDYFRCTYRGKIQAKNKGEISMYYVETALS